MVGWCSTRALVPLIVAALLFALMLQLGFWQLDRARFKEALEQRIAANRDAPPQPPDRLLADAQDGSWQFRRAWVHGNPDSERQYLLDNRVRDGRAGYHVLLAVSAPSGHVLVNRGWVPVGPDRSVLPRIDLDPATTRFVGRLADPPHDGLLLGESGYDAPGWPKVIQQVDLERMGAQLGRALLPAVVLLDADDKACFACDWKPVGAVSVDRHRGYAVQWFALAGALVVIAVVVPLAGRCRRERS